MGRRDALPMLLLTAVYAATAFFQLGDITAPQSFLSFSQRDTVSFRLDKPYTLSKVGWVLPGWAPGSTFWRSRRTG